MIITIFYLLSKISENYTYNIIKRRLLFIVFYTNIYYTLIHVSHLRPNTGMTRRVTQLMRRNRMYQDFVGNLLVYILYSTINNAWLYRLLAILFLNLLEIGHENKK